MNDTYKSKMIIGNFILIQKKHYNWFRKLIYRILFDITIVDIKGEENNE